MTFEELKEKWLNDPRDVKASVVWSEFTNDVRNLSSPDQDKVAKELMPIMNRKRGYHPI